ncbi:hypothetical protein SAMN04488570_0026 [Nocardioides scoriae]|uniref:Integral membrane protein n=1 Tax=Nocardioides scoriae TaxID=642780 RepID=A0A1H1L3B6_9ACTN|nr:hypothetical protein [Nocardioides scoriae]SDR68983.1 hypothetical protein SAMN04488570_0026 [Nocardioides scoriae]
MTEPGPGPAHVHDDHWFVEHGLPWFVPERRERAHRALHSPRVVLGLALVAAASLLLGGLLAWATGSPSLAPASLLTATGVAAVAYAGTALGAWPIARWAVLRTLGSLPMLFPLVTRALPLLLLFITFLFVNAEVWQLSATLDGGVLWLTVLLFAAIGVVFLHTRLAEELDRVDDAAGAPQIHGLEKANLILVLMIAQAVQVLLLAVTVFAFFMVFGGLVMTHTVQEAWTQQDAVQALPWADNLSVELVQVSVFLAAFSGLYFTVYAVTDETYRDQFFTEIKAELDRAVEVRAAYLAERSR